MNTVQRLLTDHIDIWTAAETEKKSGRGRAASSAASVYGIKKLRELILELAARGKLVPQDAREEPASEILKRIQTEKTKLLSEGRIKKDRQLPPLSDAEKYFDLPTGWEWSRFGEYGTVGSSSRVHQKDWTTSGIPFYRAREIVLLSRHGSVDNELFISEDLFRDLTVKGIVPEANDLMITGVGTIGVPYVVRENDRFYFKDASVLIFKNHHSIFTDYLFLFLISPIWNKKIHAESMGTTVHTLTIARANEVAIPIPPLAEQHRIVAKVNELMALCDQLEAQHSDAADAHEQLVRNLLDTLTQSQSASDFDTNWQRIAAHFDTLFATEASIDALKQTLLQLAVMGKLVAQDADDEPASDLLKRIQTEKAKLIAEGTIKKDKPSEKIEEKEIRFAIPSTWKWVRMADLCRPISSGSTPSAELFQYDKGVPFLKVYNIRNQEIDFEYKKQFIDESLNSTKLSRSILIPGDVVMNIVGPPLGKVAIIPDTYSQWNCNQAIVFFGLIKPINIEYVLNYFKEGSFLQDIELIGTAGQDNISVSKSKNILVPVPPLAEQHRIVAKVDQLMVLCDQLRSCVAGADQLQKKLADVLVEQAVVA
jgi:type I restriction enzyme S subunit